MCPGNPRNTSKDDWVFEKEQATTSHVTTRKNGISNTILLTTSKVVINDYVKLTIFCVLSLGVTFIITNLFYYH